MVDVIGLDSPYLMTPLWHFCPVVLLIARDVPGPPQLTFPEGSTVAKLPSVAFVLASVEDGKFASEREVAVALPKEALAAAVLLSVALASEPPIKAVAVAVLWSVALALASPRNALASAVLLSVALALAPAPKVASASAVLLSVAL